MAELQYGVHDARPTTGQTSGALYLCLTHRLIYQTVDGGHGWATWGELTASGGGGGSALAVSEEGAPLDTAVTSIDFVGDALTATNVGHAVTVTSTAIPQGGPLTATLEADGNGITSVGTLGIGTVVSLTEDMDGNLAVVSSGGITLNGDPVTFGITSAADPEDIADPSSATAEDVANKLNDLMAAMRASGYLVTFG